VQVGYETAEISNTRTSDSAALPYIWEGVIRARLKPLLGPDYANPPASVLVMCDVLRYRQHQQFEEHHDGGHRRFSAIIYLTDLPGADDGGETVFTKLNLKIKPKAGTDADPPGPPLRRV
jgi:hypothetical protein